MEKYFFIVRSASGNELYSKELAVEKNIFSLAQTLMDVVRNERKDVFPERCEVWFKPDMNHMSLLVTVF